MAAAASAEPGSALRRAWAAAPRAPLLIECALPGDDLGLDDVARLAGLRLPPPPAWPPSPPAAAGEAHGAGQGRGRPA